MHKTALDKPINSTFFYLRLVTIFLLLTTEVIILSVLFDFKVTELKENSSLFIQLSSHASSLFKLVAFFIAVFLLMISPRTLEVFNEIKKSKHTWRLWLATQLLAFGLLVLCTGKILPSSSYIFSSYDVPIYLEAKWFLGWFILGGFTLISWLLTLAPWAFWKKLCQRDYQAIVVAIFATLIAWLFIVIADAYNLSFNAVTVQCVHQVLLWIFPEVIYFPLRQTVGLPFFAVDVSTGCSGYEGMVVISVFISVYLWLFRKELKFPYVLCLFPIGIVAILMANVARLVSMIIFGRFVSPEIALGALHSQAGWINFILISLVLILLAHYLFSHKADNKVKTLNPSLDIALAVPGLVMMGLLMLTSAVSDGLEVLYPLRILITAIVLWHFRGLYQKLDWSWSWPAVGIGVFVFIIWTLFEPSNVDNGPSLEAHLSELPKWFMITWLTFRVIGSAIVVPIAEEFAFRGFLIRKLVTDDFENITEIKFTWLSFMASSIIFGVLHGYWILGIVAGMAFAVALYQRGQLADAVLAHAVANTLIAVNVLVFDHWSYWE
jgi:exosortase E/protease (VPEID-CTERM system)